MKKVTLIYTADANLMNDSKVLIAVCENKQKAIDLIFDAVNKKSKLHYKDCGYTKSSQMREDAIYNLRTISQTQRFDENYIFEDVEFNTVF